MEIMMTTELFYLLLTAILTGVLWIPVVIGYVLARGPLKPSRRSRQLRRSLTGLIAPIGRTWTQLKTSRLSQRLFWSHMQSACQLPLPRFPLPSTSLRALCMPLPTQVDSVFSWLVPSCLRLPGSRFWHSQLNCYDMRYEKVWLLLSGTVRFTLRAPHGARHSKRSSSGAGWQESNGFMRFFVLEVTLCAEISRLFLISSRL